MLVMRFEGVNFPVAIDFGTIEQYRQMGAMSFAKTMIDAGGYAAGRVDFAKLAELKTVRPEIDIEGLEGEADGRIVSVLREIDDLLTESQAKCIIYHELGHIVNGDFDNDSAHIAKKTTACGGSGLNSEAAEIAADRFSAKHFGYATLLDALVATLKARAKVAAENGAKASAEEIESTSLAEFYASERYAEIKRNL